MKKRRWFYAGAALAAVAALTVTGFAVAGSSSSKLTKVTIQLKWVTQAQFAGYYAAKAKGYYEDAGLDVNLKLGGPDIVNEQIVLVEAGRVRDRLARRACSPTGTRATTSSTSRRSTLGAARPR